MRNQSSRHRLTALAVLVAGSAQAAPIEGELSSNAAALLVLLGIWALLMGMRNLRQLRHKHLVLNRDWKNATSGQVKNPNPEAHT